MPEDKKPPKPKVALPYRVELWGGLSVLAFLISLALPWWGIDITPASFSWGAFSGPAQPSTLVIFFADRLDQAFSQSYVFITSLVVVTSGLAALGSFVKRWPILIAALLSSVVTDLSFMADVANALGSECARTIVAPASCISGLVGSGSAGTGYVTWGFKSGFYVFAASGILTLAALVLQLRWKGSRNMFPRQ